MIILINNVPFNETELNVTPVFDCEVSSYLYGVKRSGIHNDIDIDELINYVKSNEKITERRERELRKKEFIGYLKTCIYCFVVQRYGVDVYSRWYKTKEEASSALAEFVSQYNKRGNENYSFFI